MLELARRGARGSTVALDPGGFWTRSEVRFFQATLGPSVLHFPRWDAPREAAELILVATGSP